MGFGVGPGDGAGNGAAVGAWDVVGLGVGAGETGFSVGNGDGTVVGAAVGDGDGATQSTRSTCASHDAAGRWISSQ